MTQRLLIVGAAVALMGGASGFSREPPQAQVATPGDREDAYRANNVGVAHLEQYLYGAAADDFRQALAIDPSLAMAKLNLAVALLYDNRIEDAAREAQRAVEALPASPRPLYVRGLIARLQNRLDEAADAFDRVLRLDPDDVGSLIYLGQIRLQERRYDEAIALFRRAGDREPYNATAAYNLAVALTRSGSRDEGQSAMQRFQRLRDSAYATTYASVYLEQGRYGEALASTGAESSLVDIAMPAVKYTDVTNEWLPGGAEWEPLPELALTGQVVSGSADDSRERLAASLSGAVSLIDLDRDGDLDLLAAQPRGLRAFENDGRGHYRDVTTSLGLTPQQSGSVTGVLAGDIDNDGGVDLFVLTSTGHRVLRRESSGQFRDVTADAAVPAYPELARTAALVDVDHDGDLDAFVAGFARLVRTVSPGGGAISTTALEPAAAQLLRNNGNTTFTDLTTDAGLTERRRALAIVPTDFDNRRDIDLFVLSLDGPPAMLQNARDGTFRDVSDTLRLPSATDYTSVAAADVNKDGFVDVFLGRSGSTGVLGLSDGIGGFSWTEAPASTAGAVSAQFSDYDMDGLLDLFVLGAEAPVLLRNLGATWSDVTAAALGPVAAIPGTRFRALAIGDLDGDGDQDIVVRDASRLRVWRSDGGVTNRSISVRLEARVSNRSAAGARIEMRAGSLRQRIETSAVTPAVAPADLVFGLGRRARADVVRVLWPAGILQAEIDPPASPAATEGRRQTLTITELDRKPSSCPYLYTWNGGRFEFITDFLGGGEMGAWLAPGVRNVPDPDEYVRITGDRLRARDGRFDLRITNELEEALFIDRVQLLAIDHPSSVEVFPDEGLTAPPYKPFKLYAVSNARSLMSATDDGGESVLDRLERVDRKTVDSFEHLSIRGYAAEHSLTFRTGPGSGGPEALLLTGWTDYAFSSDNVAAHQSGLRMTPPRVERRERDGSWRTIVEQIGFPVGRPQTIVVPLPPGPAEMPELRLVTTMRIYWDQIRVAALVGTDRIKATRLDAATADLRWRGFSAEVSPDGREPFGFDYHRVSETSPWKVVPGLYTREGDVRELVSSTDDMFVVSRTGDEVALSFDADHLSSLGPDQARTFLLFADGFSKEMDINSSNPDQVEPMPFHRMSGYPYRAPEAYPSTRRHREYLDRYNTRRVRRALPSIDAALVRNGEAGTR